MQNRFSEHNNIYMMGFMGCGKTTVGTQLAEKLNRPFKDTDTIIEKKTGLSVSAIFNTYGEKKFRVIEKEVISEVSQLKNNVIALGGGTVLFSENWEKISSTGITVTLSLSPEIIFSRLRKDSSRPLVNSSSKNSVQFIRNLMRERKPYYKKADLYLHSDTDQEPDTIVNKILLYLDSENRIRKQ